MPDSKFNLPADAPQNGAPRPKEHAVARAFRRVFDFLKQNTNDVFWYAVALTVFSGIAIALKKAQLVSLAGLIWMLVWLGIFCLVVFINKILAFFKIELKEVGELPEQATRWERLVVWVLNYAKRNPFTAAGLAIAIGHAVILVHIHAAAGLLDTFLTFSYRTWLSAVFTLGAVVAGYVTDAVNKSDLNVEQRGGVVYLLGFVQFYASFMVLVTGLIGGAEALKSAYLVVRQPWQLVTHDIFSVQYLDTYSHAILQGTGGFFFFFFYLLLPLGIGLAARRRLREAKKQGLQPFLPLLALEALRAVSVFMLLIGLFVGWNEGWISRVFQFLLLVVAYVIDWVAGLLR